MQRILSYIGEDVIVVSVVDYTDGKENEVPNENLITLREKARQAELSLARAKSKQDSAQEALTKVEQEIRDLGFDPADKGLGKKIEGMVEEAKTLLASVQSDLEKIQEALG